MSPNTRLNVLHMLDLIFAFTALYDLSTLLIPFTQKRELQMSLSPERISDFSSNINSI